jgi:predicted phage baseplate assembly protein
LLDTVYRQFNANDWVILDSQGSVTAAQILMVYQTSVTMTVGSSTSTSQGTTTSTANVPVTWLWVRTPMTGPSDGGASLVVRFGLSRIAETAAETSLWLQPADPLALSAATPAPDGSNPARIALADVNGTAVAGAASVDLTNRAITAFTPDAGASRPALQLPVNAFGNLLTASRGESVIGEVLGSGDASQQNQSFALQKKPLTYLPDPNGPGLLSTLRVWVNGVAWREVATLYNVVPGTPVYMVRTDKDGAATITFPLLPTGQGNVVANYRFGAGAAAPPAGAVRQIARPVPGLVSASNPLPAFGGQDAEAPNRIRRYAPASALQLGRAVSLADMEAIAAGTPGVRAARANWTWGKTMQRPGARIVYVGDAALGTQIAQALRGCTDPATPMEVVGATIVPVTLALQVTIDPDYVAADVLAALSSVYAADLDGMLVPEQLGIGQPVFRSQLVAAALAVSGITGLSALNWNGAPFADYAETPGEDSAFDFLSAGDIVLNGSGLHG